MQCKAETKAGKRCRNKAIDGSAYCQQHTQSRKTRKTRKIHKSRKSRKSSKKSVKTSLKRSKRASKFPGAKWFQGGTSLADTSTIEYNASKNTAPKSRNNAIAQHYENVEFGGMPGLEIRYDERKEKNEGFFPANKEECEFIKSPYYNELLASGFASMFVRYTMCEGGQTKLVYPLSTFQTLGYQSVTKLKIESKLFKKRDFLYSILVHVACYMDFINYHTNFGANVLWDFLFCSTEEELKDISFSFEVPNEGKKAFSIETIFKFKQFRLGIDRKKKPHDCWVLFVNRLRTMIGETSGSWNLLLRPNYTARTFVENIRDTPDYFDTLFPKSNFEVTFDV